MESKYICEYVILLIMMMIIVLYIYIYQKREYFSMKYINHVKPRNYQSAFPKNIFLYWHESEISNPLVRRNIEYLRHLCGKEYMIRVYNEKNIKSELSEEELKYMEKSKQHFADYVRLFLLEKYGGFWMDASILITNKSIFDHICNVYEQEKKFDVFLFEYSAKNAGSTEQEKYLENWFIAAPQRSIFIRDMLEEYKEALRTSFATYKSKLVKENINLKNTLEDDNHLYLIQHGIIKLLLKRKKYIIAYEYAQDSMFRINDECNWKGDCIFDKMKDLKSNLDIYGVKLTGGLRDHFASKGDENLGYLFQNLYHLTEEES